MHTTILSDARHFIRNLFHIDRICTWTDFVANFNQHKVCLKALSLSHHVILHKFSKNTSYYLIGHQQRRAHLPSITNLLWHLIWPVFTISGIVCSSCVNITMIHHTSDFILFKSWYVTELSRVKPQKCYLWQAMRCFRNKPVKYVVLIT